MPPIVLLGPQRLQRTLGAAVEQVGAEGAFAVVTAGWEEREDEIDELRAHLDRRVVNLRLYARAEEAFREDPELFGAYRERRVRLREAQDLHRIRLDHMEKALRRLMRADGRPDVLEAERRDAIEDVRRLDAHQLRRIADIHREFEERVRPGERPSVARRRREVAALLGECGALAVAGGNVAVLANRLRLFDVTAALGERPVFAWSAGAMACAERIVLFHDDPPQGPGNPEVFGHGLDLYRGVLPLPHASRRLDLGDPVRVSTFARRFAPMTCVALDPGHGLWTDGATWRPATGGARKLTPEGAVVEMFGP